MSDDAWAARGGNLEDDSAVEALRKLAEGGGSGAALALGNRCFDDGRFAEAEAHYRRAIGLGKQAARYDLGCALYEQDKLDEAESLFREIIAEGDLRAAVALANLLAQRNDPDEFEEAEGLFRRGLVADVEYALLGYATLLAQWPGRRDEAERMYRQCIEEGETDAHNSLASFLHEYGDDEEAEVEYRLGIAAGDAWAWHGLGNLLRENERLEEAEEAFKAAIAGGKMEARRDLANLYLEMDRDDDAERVCLDGIESGDDDCRLHLGILYHEVLGRFEDAERQYHAAIDAGVERARISLANLLDDTDRHVEAETEYRRVIDNGRSLPNATYNLAVCLERQGREQEALEGFQTAATLGFKPARRTLAERERTSDPAQEGLDVWVGLVTLKPVAGNDMFEGAAGAVTNACALAADEADYQLAVEEKFRRMDLQVVDIEDLERFAERARRLDPDADIFETAAAVSREAPVVYDEFYVYESEED